MVPPDYKVRIIHANIVLTSKFYIFITKAMHDWAIERNIICKAHWDPNTFKLVDWDAYERTYWRLPWSTHHYTSKLIHSLFNTNKQNQLYYSKSALCLICQEYDDLLEHVFTRQHTLAVAARDTNLKMLADTLVNVQTPLPVIDAICHGFSSWATPTQCFIRALMAGSLRGPDAILTSAFHEQYNTIGWLGRSSKKWAAAARQYNPVHKPPDFEEYWMSLLLTALWHNSRALRKNRNEQVHSNTIAVQTTVDHFAS